MAPKQDITDWQLECGQIRERAGRILKMEQWTDCSFVVGADAEKVEVKTHKLILAMASPVFEAMFYGSLKEGNDPIRIPDMQPAAFKALMEYIYTDNIEINSYNMACDLFYGAQKYMLPQLQTVCVEYLAGNLNPEIVCSVYEFALVVGEEKLIKECESVIQSKTTEVLKGGSFLEVELDTVVHIFSLPFMNVENELVLVRAADLYDRSHQKARTAKMFERAMEGATGHSIDKSFANFKVFNFTFGSAVSDQITVPDKNETKRNATNSKSDGDLLKKKCDQNLNDNDGKLAEVSQTLDKTPTQACLSEDTNPRPIWLSPQASKQENSSKARPILPLLRKINFLTLTTQQIAEEKTLRTLLTTDELLAVVMNAASSNTFVPMPPGFSVTRNIRNRRDLPLSKSHGLGAKSHKPNHSFGFQPTMTFSS